jgi:hypothetical protein
MCYSELIKANNEGLWDWITWETLCNPDHKFQKGDIAMKFGLWRADYALLCQYGDPSNHADGGYGRGAVKIDILPEFDYRPHKDLIKTYLPFMEIDTKTGSLIDPISKDTVNQAEVGKYWVVMPYNYDDNSIKSDAIGTKAVFFGELKKEEPKNSIIVVRLTATQTRWSTASRSGIALMCPNMDVNTLHVYQKIGNSNNLKDYPWRLRDRPGDKANIFGADITTARNTTYTKTLTTENAAKFYSVKTGVQYVGTEDQLVNSKDLLEANSLHAMKRSSLIAYVRKNYLDGSLKARHQIEILCVQLKRDNPDKTKPIKDPLNPNKPLPPWDKIAWDGFQVRDICANPNEVWFPAHVIPSSGKAFAHAWSKTNDWVTFWKDNFAKPLGRAKAEMLAFFGLQHQTSNAQNMLIAFDKTKPGTPCKCVILRDLGDTLLNDHAYTVLNGVDRKFQAAWEFEINPNQKGGSTFSRPIGGGYADPMMTRVGATIIFFFPPFRKGDLADGAAKTLANWGIALNESFLAYFQDEVGYTSSWQAGNGEGMLPSDLYTDLKAYAADMKPEDKYKALKDKVLSLHSKQRLALVVGIVEECNKKLHPNEPETAKKLVGAHDMLIGAEVECYLKSDAGKQNLLALHKKYRREG